MKEAIELTIQYEWRDVCFINDLQIIIDTINSKSSEPRWEIYALIQKIRTLVNVFSNFKLKAVRRNRNVNAHLLAKSDLRLR